MLFASRRDEIECAFVREAQRRKWERFSHHFDRGPERKEWVVVTFWWDVPMGGSPITCINFEIPPSGFQHIDYTKIREVVRDTEIGSAQWGFDPTNPFAVMRANRADG